MSAAARRARSGSVETQQPTMARVAGCTRPANGEPTCNRMNIVSNSCVKSLNKRLRGNGLLPADSVRTVPRFSSVDSIVANAREAAGQRHS